MLYNFIENLILDRIIGADTDYDLKNVVPLSGKDVFPHLRMIAPLELTCLLISRGMQLKGTRTTSEALTGMRDNLKAWACYYTEECAEVGKVLKVALDYFPEDLAKEDSDRESYVIQMAASAIATCEFMVAETIRDDLDTFSAKDQENLFEDVSEKINRFRKETK